MLRSTRRSGFAERVAFRDELGDELTDYNREIPARREVPRPRANFDNLVMGLFGAALRKSGEIR